MIDSTRNPVADTATLAAWFAEPHQPVTLGLSRQTMFSLSAIIQLALRHPHQDVTF